MGQLGGFTVEARRKTIVHEEGRTSQQQRQLIRGLSIYIVCWGSKTVGDLVPESEGSYMPQEKKISALLKMENLSKAQMASDGGWGWGEGSCFRSAVLVAMQNGYENRISGAKAIPGLLQYFNEG